MVYKWYKKEKVMITISLDEYGQFEKSDKKPLYIGGFIYDDLEESDEVNIEEHLERERIEAYYKRVVKDAGEKFNYPKDLHSNNNAKRNHIVVSKIKNKISETLPEFISNGTYKGSPLYNDKGNKIIERKGKYHLFIMLKSDDGKKRLLSDNANMLANDDWAANRYFHMAGSVVNRIILHNPLYKQGHIPAVNIDIATRSTGNLNGLDNNLVEQFREQAYRVNSNSTNGYRYYSIMNADIYRTLLAQEMINSGNVSVKIEKLYVRSIKYKANEKNMEFLYMADSICSVLGYNLKGESADDWLEQIIERMNHLNPYNENLIFGYDEIDNYFDKAWKLYEQRALYEALSIIYDARVKKGKFAEFYSERWFTYLEERIRECVTPEAFSRSVNNLSSMLTVNNLDQEKLLYLLKQFELMADAVSGKYKSKDMISSTLYKLYDAGVSAFCHIGDSIKALECYDKCKQYAFYIGVDAYMKTNNKLIVCFEDSFEWYKALDLALENEKNQKLVSEMKQRILKSAKSSGFLDEAKSISQLARIYAELRDKKAEKFFRKALDMLEKGSANYKITQSYLLHFYADMGKRELFEKEADDYFDGRDTYNKRLRYIVNIEEKADSVFSKEYALYVLIRGLLYFHKDDITDSFWQKLCNLDETLTSKTNRTPGGHPWEIIYKYLEMLAIYRKDNQAREKFARLKEESVTKKGDTIEALNLFGDAEVADCEMDVSRRDLITLELLSMMKERFVHFKDIEFPECGADRYRKLQNYFTFMYR